MDRRGLLGAAAGASAVLVAGKAEAQAQPATPSPAKTYVLVHGAYGGGWIWRDVAEGSRVAWTGDAGAATPAPAVVQATRTEIGRPSSSIRLSAWTATSTSVARRRSVRERSPSPITCLNLPMAASARARFV